MPLEALLTRVANPSAALSFPRPQPELDARSQQTARENSRFVEARAQAA